MTPRSIEELRVGGKRAMAAALTSIEAAGEAAAGLLDEAYGEARAQVVGLTGPPGVGKSTLTNALVRDWRAEGLSVGVLAVDPSSRVSGGALLGDRARITSHAGDERVFVRSLATRGRLGGLSELAYPAIVLMRAVYDRLIVESVGVGQSETDIAEVVDTLVLCIQPGSGDSLQFMKAGIMELPHIAVVTKADVGAAARRAESEAKAALSLSGSGDDHIEVLAVSAASGEGLDRLRAALAAHWRTLAAEDRIEQVRAAQAGHWLERSIVEAHGRRGLAALRSRLGDLAGASPFGRLQALLGRIAVTVRSD